MATDLQKWIWDHQLGHSGADLHADVLRDTYKWAQDHHITDDTRIEDHAITLEGERHTPGYSFGDLVQQAVSPPGHFGHSKSSSGPPTQTPTTNLPATDPVKADAAGIKTGNPTIDAAIQAALAGGTTQGSVTLWPSLGVDPQASVLGTRTVQAPGVNTMNAQGIMQHGADVSTQSMPETKTADSWLKGLYKMSPQDLATLQNQLWSQGWYTGTNITDPTMIHYGRPDAATLAAYGEALGETARYNAASRDFTISDVIMLGSPNKGQSKNTTPAPITFTAPADVQSNFQAASQNLTGQEMPTGDFQSYYHGLEAAQAHNSGDNYTAAPTPGNAATQYLINNDPSQVQAYGTASRMQELYSMLGIRG